MPTGEETVEFMTYQFPKEVTDDSEIFTHIARMSDAILQRVDPTNLVLMEYLETINPDDGSGKLLPKETVVPLKKSCKSKKDAKITSEKLVQEPKKKKSPLQLKSQKHKLQMLWLSLFLMTNKRKQSHQN